MWWNQFLIKQQKKYLNFTTPSRTLSHRLLCFKKQLFQKFREIFFNWSSRFFKGVLKIFENVQEKLSYAVLYSKSQVFKLKPPSLPCMFLKFWKIPDNVCLLFTAAGVNRFSAEQLKSFQEKSQESLGVYLKKAPPWMFCWKVCRHFWRSYFFRTQID